MNDSELFLCPGAAFSHLRTSPTCDMMGTTKVSEKPHDRGKKRGKSDDAKESIKENMIMAREIINTEKAPAAIGPYSQAIEVNGMVYTSGIIPVVPATGEIPEGSVAQAKQALTNLSNLLEAAGTNMDKVVKTTVFIKEMNDFAAINEVYKTFFTTDFPARSCVEVARLPKDVMLEIEAIAIK